MLKIGEARAPAGGRRKLRSGAVFFSLSASRRLIAFFAPRDWNTSQYRPSTPSNAAPNTSP